jgi:hypothetical protein
MIFLRHPVAFFTALLHAAFAASVPALPVLDDGAFFNPAVGLTPDGPAPAET